MSQDVLDTQASSPDEEKRRLAADESSFGKTFRQQHPYLWASTLLGPLAVTLLILAAVYGLEGAQYVQRLLLTALATFFFFGKFVILGGADPAMSSATRFFSAEELFGLVFYMDLLAATLLVFHAGFLFKLPMVGEKLLTLVEDGRFILKNHRWMRRATFVGIVAFVMFPLAATGSIGGAIFGRLLGMSRAAAFAGIALGSFLGCSVMYMGSELVNSYLDRDNPWLAVAGILVIAGLILLLNLRYRRLKQWDRDGRRDATGPSGETR